jgi:biotin carboxylase
MKKKILIVGGSHSEIPLIQAAKKLGLYVMTTGNQKNGLGHQYADAFYTADYSDNEVIYRLAKRLQVDHICFGAHDLSMLSTVYAATKLSLGNFDDLETTKILHHKDKFKAFARRHGLLTPQAESFGDYRQALTYVMKLELPFVVKPVDLGGGKGIRIVRHAGEVEAAIQNAFDCSREGKIVVEEFFEGSLHSFSTFIQNQKVVFYFADDEYPCPSNPYGVCTSASPATNFDAVRSTLINQTEKIAELLHLKDGLLHMQYLQNGEEVAVVEFTRRMPGDMYNRPVEISTGVDYAENIIRFCCGMQVEIEERPQEKFVSRHCITADSFHDIVFSDAIVPHVFDKIIWGNRQGTEKKGIVFLQYDSYDEMIQKTSRLNEWIVVEP